MKQPMEAYFKTFTLLAVWQTFFGLTVTGAFNFSTSSEILGVHYISDIKALAVVDKGNVHIFSEADHNTPLVNFAHRILLTTTSRICMFSSLRDADLIFHVCSNADDLSCARASLTIESGANVMSMKDGTEVQRFALRHSNYSEQDSDVHIFCDFANNTGDAEGYVYVMLTPGNLGSAMSVWKWEITPTSARLITPEKGTEDMGDISANNVYSFRWDNYLYVMRNAERKDFTNSNSSAVKLSRYCLADSVPDQMSIIEIDLKCSQQSGSRFDASIVKALAGYFSAETNNLTVLFDSSNSDTVFFCSYSMQKLTKDYDAVKAGCNSGAQGILTFRTRERLDFTLRQCRYARGLFDCNPVDKPLYWHVEDQRGSSGDYLGSLQLKSCDTSTRPFMVSKMVTYRNSVSTLNLNSALGDFVSLVLLSTDGDCVVTVLLDDTLTSSNIPSPTTVNTLAFVKQNPLLVVAKSTLHVAAGMQVTPVNYDPNELTTCEACVSMAKALPAIAGDGGWCFTGGGYRGRCVPKSSCPQGAIFVVRACPPIVRQMHPSTGLGGEVIEVSGSGFTVPGMTVDVLLCGSECRLAGRAQDDKFSCTVPAELTVDTKCELNITVHTDTTTVLIPNFGTGLYFTIQSPRANATFQQWLIVILVIFGVGVLLVVAFLFVKCYRRRKASKDAFSRLSSDRQVLPQSEVRYAVSFRPGRDNALMHDYSPTESYDRLPETVPREIRVFGDNLEMGEVIGEGHFGVVLRGVYKHEDGVRQSVAIKTLHLGARNIRSFLQEGILMQDLKHPRVLSLVGICFTDHYLPMIITPYMPNGNLLSYLRNTANHPNLRKLLNFAVQIAEGVLYLHKIKFIHRDLAARNCMLDEKYEVKIADFGLSRDVYESETYTSTQHGAADLPIRWMAPEAVELGVYDVTTDVWAYGVVLWELMTRGEMPYAGISAWELVSFIKSGNRLAQPPYCPNALYKIMQSCWALVSSDRPTFAQLTQQVPDVIEQLERRSDSRHPLDHPYAQPRSSQTETVLSST